MPKRGAWTGNTAAWSFTTERSGGTFTDGYDAEDHFRRFIQSSQSNDIYLARSDIGNITDVEINSTSHLRSYSNAHELTSVDGTAQTFDEDGNLTLSHHGITVAWDDANRLTQTVVPATATAGIEGTNDYGYDADGKRVWKKITRSGAVAEHMVYIYAGPNCIAEYNSGALAVSPEQEYVYADGIDSLVLLSRNSDADRYVATRNQQWSITALADISNGTVQERYTYGPFGKRTVLAPDGSTVRTASSYNMPYGYTSRRHDPESDLMYFRARFYDPTTGEFTSRDPLEYVDGTSLMRSYMGVEGIDPSGRVTVTHKENNWDGKDWNGKCRRVVGSGIKSGFKPNIYEVTHNYIAAQPDFVYERCFIVQLVTIHCYKKQCTENCECGALVTSGDKPELMFLEVKELEPEGGASNLFKPMPHFFGYNPEIGFCGHKHATAIVKVFCEHAGTDRFATWLNLRSQWDRNPEYPVCDDIAKAGPYAMNVTNKVVPSFFINGKSDNGNIVQVGEAADVEFILDYKCCGGESDTVAPSYHPR